MTLPMLQTLDCQLVRPLNISIVLHRSSATLKAQRQVGRAMKFRSLVRRGGALQNSSPPRNFPVGLQISRIFGTVADVLDSMGLRGAGIRCECLQDLEP